MANNFLKNKQEKAHREDVEDGLTGVQEREHKAFTQQGEAKRRRRRRISNSEPYTENAKHTRSQTDLKH